MRYGRLAIATAMVAVPIATLIPASASTSCPSSAGTTSAECGFETPSVSEFSGYDPSGSAWTFAGFSGCPWSPCRTAAPRPWTPRRSLTTSA